MKSTIYLYGVQPEEFADMPYKEAIRFKHIKAKELHKKLFTSEIDDSKRQFYVFNAIKHTEQLLRELEGEELGDD